MGDGGRELDAREPAARQHRRVPRRRDRHEDVGRADRRHERSGVRLADRPSRGRAAPTYSYCDGQCWYDNYVVTPAGHPDMVYIGGSFDYNLYGVPVNNGRAVLLSQDAGATGTT